MAGKVIIVAAFKGGVGKSTSATNVAGALAKMGKSVLLWDCDFQANSTMAFGIDPEMRQQQGETLYEVIHGGKTIREVILTTEHGVSVVPSSDDLSAFDFDLFSMPEKFPKDRIPYLIRDIIEEVRDLYDFHIVDTGPSLSMLSVNTMVAADLFLIPTQVRRFGVRGTQKYIHRLQEIRNAYLPDRKYEAYLFATFYGKSKNVSAVALQEMRKIGSLLGEPFKTLDTVIPERVQYENAQAFRGLPSTLIDNERDEAVRAYFDLVREALFHDTQQ